MVSRNRSRVAVALVLAAVGYGGAGVARATSYSGNGATGFGGPVGTGALAVTDDGAGHVTFTLTPGAVHPTVDGNSLVVYLSTGAPGLSDTTPLTDNGDTGRRAISGYNNPGPGLDPTRSVIAFPSGFQASYALSMENAYVGLFKLPPADGDGGLTYLNGSGQSSTILTVTLPLSDLGLTQGQSFQFVGTLLDGNAAYRSNETVGPTSPDISQGGNPGFNNLITFSSALTYQTTVVGGTPSTWASTTGGTWNTATNWTSGVPNAPGAAATFGTSITANATVTLDGDKTVGTVRFDNAAASYTIASGTAGTLTINNAGGAAGTIAGISVVSGNHTVTAPIQLAAGMTATTVAGTRLTLAGGLNGAGDLTVAGAGTTVLNGVNAYAGNTVVNTGARLDANGSLPATALSAAGTVNLGANAGAGLLARSFSAINLAAGTGVVRVGAPSAASARTVLVTGGLTFAGTPSSLQGLLDLGANDMIVRGGNADTTREQLRQGRAGTAGIASSAAAASTSPRTAIGYAAVTATGTFDGQAVAAGDVVLKYTLVGDANLDSAVNFNDLLALAQNYGASSTRWATGDFDYDGQTLFADLLGLAQNYGAALSTSDRTRLAAAGSPSFAADFALAQSLVPEPAALAAVLSAAGVLTRRRR